MSVHVAINGFGRIGRALLRSAHERAADIQIVAVNDVADAATLAALLRHDSVYGRFPGSVEEADGALIVDGDEIRVLAEPDPAKLPWGELGVDVVMESTGRFRTRAAAAQHLAAGAQKVIISAPAKGDEPADATVVLGVNFDETYDPAAHHVITNASCTTNCLAPVAKVLHETVGIRHGLMTTIHAYTADQNLQDGPHKDPRRARAAAINIVPTTTGAAKAVSRVLPQLAGKLDGYAMRVPVPTGSATDLTFTAARPVSVEAVNAVMRRAAESPRWQGLMSYTEDPVVSADIAGDPHISIFDAGMTKVIGDLVKVVAWYDNEWGYAHSLVEITSYIGQRLSPDPHPEPSPAPQTVRG